jgi:hypothetical protein
MVTQTDPPPWVNLTHPPGSKCPRGSPGGRAEKSRGSRHAAAIARAKNLQKKIFWRFLTSRRPGGLRLKKPSSGPIGTGCAQEWSR